MRGAWMMMSVLVLGGCVAEAQPSGRADYPVSEDSFAARRVWSGTTDPWGGVAPDGSFVTTPDDATGDLAVLDLESDELRRLTNVAEPWGEHWAEKSAVSLDGRRVAYTWADASGPFAWELRSVGVDGSGERAILRLTDGGYVYPIGWSAGDSAVVVQLSHEGENEIALVSVADGRVRTVARLGARYTEGSVSPDGRFVAYTYPDKPDSPRHDVHVLNLATGARSDIATRDADEAVLGWIDQNTLLYSSDAPGAPAVLSVQVREGRAASEPVLVRSDVWGLSPYGGFNGGILYGVTTSTVRLHTVQLDPATGAALGSPEALTGGRDPATLASAWSPDADRIAYYARPHIRIRSVDTGEERVLAPVFNFVGDIVWSADGRRLFIWANYDGAPGTFELDLASGSVRLLGRTGAITKDGTHVLRTRAGADPQQRVLIEHELATGQERVIAERLPGNAAFVSLHPDGTGASFVVNPDAPGEHARLMLVDLTTGAVRELTSLPAGRHIDGRGRAAWSPDGRRVLFVSLTASGDDKVLQALTIDGGAPVEVVRMPNVSYPRFHPSGNRILFSAGEEQSELWTLRRAF